MTRRDADRWMAPAQEQERLTPVHNHGVKERSGKQRGGGSRWTVQETHLQCPGPKHDQGQE